MKKLRKFIGNRFRNYISYKCPSCNKNIECRADHKNKTGLCQKCSARKLMLKKLVGGKDHTSYKNGITLYRKHCYEENDKKCIICKSIRSVHIHHIDGNRENNETENLTPLCCGCHMYLHHRLSDGLSYKKAIEMTLNKPPIRIRKSSYVKKQK